MDKTKLIPALIISIAILVLLIITTVVTNINKGNKTNTSEGESYLAALESQDVKKVENNLRDSDPTRRLRIHRRRKHPRIKKRKLRPMNQEPNRKRRKPRLKQRRPSRQQSLIITVALREACRQVFTEVTSRVICRIPLTAIKHPLWQTNWQREQFPPKRSLRIPFLSVTQ